jgi:glutamate/tyrosine decarboxylase-like PLP-dependent enzyme
MPAFRHWRGVAATERGALSSMSDVLSLAHQAARRWLHDLDSRSVAATADLAALRMRFPPAMSVEGTEAETVIADLVQGAQDGLLGSASGRFFAWVIGGSLPSALAADWLVSTWEQNAALYACGPAVSVIEEAAGEMVKELLDLPREASVAFVTGCQMAHFTALAAARAAVLKRAGWDPNGDGLFGAPRIAVLANAQRHGSIDRAVRFLGLGAKSIQPIETDALGGMKVDALECALEATPGPKIVVLNAADLNVGSFDVFAKLIPLAHAAGAWVHVDGAFGLFARASRAKHYLTLGMEQADSWATDAHKWLNVPFDCGIAIVRDRDAHREAMTIAASYIAAGKAARDQIDWNPEWSRRARGVPVYAALRELGRAGVESLVERSCVHCAALVAGIGGLPGARVLHAPTLNQGLLQFCAPHAGATDEDHDAQTDAVIAAVNASGEAFFSSTVWHGRRAMRVSVVNWRTTDADVQRTIRAVEHVLRNLAR